MGYGRATPAYFRARPMAVRPHAQAQKQAEMVHGVGYDLKPQDSLLHTALSLLPPCLSWHNTTTTTKLTAGKSGKLQLTAQDPKTNNLLNVLLCVAAWCR